MADPHLDSEAQELLAVYAGLIREHASRLDLVAPGDLDRLEERHIKDSLRALPIVDATPPGPVADVGSGAGFPGIPLAVTRPDRVVRLIEPRTRRAAFLEQVVRELHLEATEVVVCDAAEAARRLGRTHACAIARALAPPERALREILPLVAAGGRAAIFVGSGKKPPVGTELSVPGIATIEAMDPAKVDK